MSARFELLPGHPHVALVTIDRPERANSLDPPTLRELAAAWGADRGRRRDPLRRAHRARAIACSAAAWT
jgi:enoyl-CoA hydratase/carnithine racemase